MSSRLNKSAALNALPPEWPDDLLAEIRENLELSQRKIVVLDDDPTGTQTVHGLAVLTGWELETLATEFAAGGRGFYILTNSRGVARETAFLWNVEIADRLTRAAALHKKDYRVISRSDSTLRGHFPAEIEALGLRTPNLAGTLLVPFLAEAGRFTLEDEHYVAMGDELVPVNETEFARDAVFAYRASNLRAWVEEKTNGRVPAGHVFSLSLAVIRERGPAGVADYLASVAGSPRVASASSLCGALTAPVVVVNAASKRDMAVVALGVARAEEKLGKVFLARTAGSYAAAACGLEPRPLLSRAEILQDGFSGGGLIVAGSHVPNTTRQLHRLITKRDLDRFELGTTELLEAGSCFGHEIAEKIEPLLARGRDVLVMTSREVLRGATEAETFEISRRISRSLVSIVQALQVRPRYLISKGGITSSDVAVHGLGIKRAWVEGQVLTGVPLWRCGKESKFPGLPLILFPGNLGGEDGLLELVEGLAS